LFKKKKKKKKAVSSNKYILKGEEWL